MTPEQLPLTWLQQTTRPKGEASNVKAYQTESGPASRGLCDAIVLCSQVTGLEFDKVSDKQKVRWLKRRERKTGRKVNFQSETIDY